jgi:predicted transcriptional regulator
VIADLLDGIRTDINARLAELRPLVDEAAQLERALAALDGTLQATKRTDRAPASPTNGGRRRRSATARGQAGQRIIEFIKANPGSTAGDVASALGLKRNSTSTRMTQLAKAGALTKDKRGYTAG